MLSKRRILLNLLALVVAAGSSAASAQSSAGLRRELVAQLTDAEQKFVALAQAVPSEKYSWRPAKGVRSISEVYMHVVGANFMIPAFAGVKPTGVKLSPDMETKVTDKAQIVDLLTKSFDFAKQAVMEVPEDQLNATVDVFGSPSTKGGALVIVTTHAREHLGQSIAYARANGVLPPWSKAPGGAP